MSHGFDFIGAHVPELSRHTSLHLNVSSRTSIRLYVSNLVHEALNAVELGFLCNFFISCSIPEISQVESDICILDFSP